MKPASKWHLKTTKTRLISGDGGGGVAVEGAAPVGGGVEGGAQCPQVGGGGDGQLARRGDRAAAKARGRDVVRRTGVGEHLERAGDVETLHAVEQDDQHGSWHVSQCAGARSWQQ